MLHEFPVRHGGWSGLLKRALRLSSYSSGAGRQEPAESELAAKPEHATREQTWLGSGLNESTAAG